MPQISGAPEGMNKIMEAAYSSALKKYPGNKAKASKIAYAAAKNAGYMKGKDGKWMMKKKEMAEVEIDSFIAGKYPQGEFGDKELSEIADTYNPKVYEAPITIPHVSSYKGLPEIPAFGWIGSVKKVGDHLKLIASQFSDELKQWYKDGIFKKVSAAFYDPSDPNNPTPGKWHLHHLAFLGGTPPAVKGLEGIQFNEKMNSYALKMITLPPNCIEMAEMETEITQDGDPIDVVEEVGTEDTIKDLTESCATFISKIEEALTNDIDYDTQKSRCQLAASDLSAEVYDCLNMHWTFKEKLENIEEHQEAEMAEKKSIKQVLIEMAQKLITNRKESTEMDTKKEQEYQAQIAERDAKLKEFAEKDRLAVEAKAKADKEAADAAAFKADEALKTEIKTFCDAAIKDNKMIPAEREKDEPIMFTLAKTSPDALKSFQEKYIVGRVPLGEVKKANEDPIAKVEDGIMKKAETYAVAHAKEKEFSDCRTKEDKTNRAVYLYQMGKIKFE